MFRARWPQCPRYAAAEMSDGHTPNRKSAFGGCDTRLAWRLPLAFLVTLKSGETDSGPAVYSGRPKTVETFRPFVVARS